MLRCLIEQGVATAIVSHPIQQGWVERPESLELQPRVRAETVRGTGNAALLSSVEAALVLDTHQIVTDFGLVSRHTGPVLLWTAARPDDVEQATIAMDDVSRTAEALARATVHHFYGIDVAGWDRDSSEGDVRLLEDMPAFRPVESGHGGDLVRAWYILTSFAIPTHLLVVPRSHLAEDPEGVRELAWKLIEASEAGAERRRELRRNLADELGLDRNRLVEFQMDQVITVSKSARKAWLDLVRRTRNSMKLPEVDESAFVSVLRTAGE